MDFLEVIESLETIPLTREVETIKGLEGFEQQDVPVWNNLTGYLGYIEVDDDTYENVLKAFLLLGEEWYLVIVTALACGGSKYEMLEIDDITSIDAGGFGPLMTSLTIDVPLSLVYSDAFNLTGELTDEDDNAISGAMVKLVIGNTVVDSKITNSSGVASFTQTPVHMGIHTFKLVYEGSDAYRNCQSSTVTRDINKETSVLNVTSPLNNTDVYSDGSISITGTLLTDDAEVLAGESILVKQGDDTLTTLTTDSTGAFSGTVAASSLSTGNLIISFETTTTHTASTATIAIVVSDPSLTLVSDKSILSYVDGDSATLTATLTGADVAGKTVSFDIVDSGGTVISNIDTAVTDENGECSVSYLSNHAGDLYIRAQSGILLSEIYEIFDILKYHQNEITRTSTSSGDTGVPIFDGFTFSNTDWEVGFKYKSDSGSHTFGVLVNTSLYHHIQFGLVPYSSSTPQKTFYVGNQNGGETAYRGMGGEFNVWIQVKMVKQGTTLQLYYDDTLYQTLTVSYNDTKKLGFGEWSVGTHATVKEIYVKAL